MATTLKVAVEPAATVKFVGWLMKVTDDGKITVSVATALVTDPRKLVITTEKEPDAFVVTLFKASHAFVALATARLFEYHW